MACVGDKSTLIKTLYEDLRWLKEKALNSMPDPADDPLRWANQAAVDRSAFLHALEDAKASHGHLEFAKQQDDEDVICQYRLKTFEKNTLPSHLHKAHGITNEMRSRVFGVVSKVCKHYWAGFPPLSVLS